jgi:tetratricopeptide (TPR) repeat protein
MKKINKAQEVVDQNFERIAKEEQYIELMKPKVDAAPEDAALLEKVTSMMVKREWLNSNFYLDASEKLYKLNPSTVAAYNLYEGHAKKGNTTEATKFLEESTASETENEAKADKLLRLAKLYGTAKKYSSARAKAQEAAGLKAGWGEPYLYIGDLYMASSNSCGDDACSKKYGFWAATDMYNRAKSTDSSIADAANKKLSSVKKYYPIAKDCFFINVQKGDKVKVGGWIGVETTARFAD